MGWIRGSGVTKAVAPKCQGFSIIPESTKGIATYMEDAGNHAVDIDNVSTNQQSTPRVDRKYKFIPREVKCEDLPFIPADEVLSTRRLGAISQMTGHPEEVKDYWIVVDNIVYDCTHFISEHPGGEQVILSFVGEDCSWQFWRFHGEKEMEEYGKELRIGRTDGIIKRFKEPVRFVGLSRLGNDY